jgi:mRNA interferase MazF
LADAGRDDWILCQITSNPYSDLRAVTLVADDFLAGSLRTVSYARPGKLFTANVGLVVGQVGSLKSDPFNRIIGAVVDILRTARTA